MDKMRAALGRRQFKRCLKGAETRFLGMDDTRELP
jgi:hypothetical protein